MIRGYLDNASTTETKFFAKDFYIPGNPNSPTAIGRKAREEFTKARERIKEHLGVKGGKVIIGGTASQLVEALYEKAKWTKGRSFGSVYEHDSIDKFINCKLETIDDLESTLEAVYKFNDPTFVAWMLTNNITGTIFDVKSIGELCHKYDAYYIMDCTASIGHNSIPEGVEDYCDCIIMSAHKFHGPSGVGCMWISSRLAEHLYLPEDTHDEYGLIPGTPDVSGAIAMSYAMDHAIGSFSENYSHYLDLYYTLIEKLHSHGIVFTDVGDLDRKSLLTVAIFALTLPGFNADALVQFLSSRGVYISAGHSACAEHDDFRVLEAFGLTKEEASQTIRVSFCEDTTLEDIDMLVDGIVSFKEKFM